MTDWFRSWHGAPTDPKWRTIAKRADVSPSLVVSVAWVLLDRASQADSRGSIDGTDVETMADFLGCEAEDIERIIAAMHDKAVLADDRFTAWERRQPKREREDETAAERKAAQRARDKGNNGSGNGGTGGVTPSHTMSHHVTPRGEQSRLDVSSLRSECEPEDVESQASAKPTGPKRATSLPPDWKLSPESRAFAVSRGMSERDIRAEVERFQAHHVSKGSRMKDWASAWRTWVLSPYRKPSAPSLPELRLPLAGGDDPIVELPGGIRWPESRVVATVAEYRTNPRSWLEMIGPPPGQPGCRIPQRLIDQARAA